MLSPASSNQVSSRFQKPLINILQECQARASQNPIVVLHCGNTLKQGTGAKRTKSMETMEILHQFCDTRRRQVILQRGLKGSAQTWGARSKPKAVPVQIWSHTHIYIYIYIIRATKGPRNVKKQTIRNRCFTVSIENRICWHMFVSVFVRCQNVYFCGGSHTKQHVIYFFSSSGLWSAFLGIAFAKRQELAQLRARLSSSRNQPVENLHNPGSSGNLGRLGRHPSCQPLPRGRFTRRPFCVPQPCMGGTCSEELDTRRKGW